MEHATPQLLRNYIDAINADSTLRCKASANIDFANHLVYGTAKPEEMEATFEILGPVASGIHVKDGKPGWCNLCPPGQGVVNFGEMIGLTVQHLPSCAPIIGEFDPDVRGTETEPTAWMTTLEEIVTTQEGLYGDVGA